jgi:predicted NBD/HSP70 family sugar kinase
MHEAFDELLRTLGKSAGIGPEHFGEVLARIALRAPHRVTRVELTSPSAFPSRVRTSLLSAPSVSKAVGALLDLGLLQEEDEKVKKATGRPARLVRLGDRWCVAGVKLELKGGRPHRVTTTVSNLDKRVRAQRVQVRVPQDLATWDRVDQFLCASIAELWDEARGDLPRQSGEPALLGAGVEIGSPVQWGRVLSLADRALRSEAGVPLADRMSERLGVPVEVENDVNALGVWELYQSDHDEADFAVVALFDEGVGGGLVLDGGLRHGGNGMAMEIGHIAVERRSESRSRQAAHRTGFAAPCACGEQGHLDTLATMARLRSELGVTRSTLSTIAESTTADRRTTAAFERSGAALGLALATLLAVADPSRLILYAPPVVTEAPAGSPGWTYMNAVHAELQRGFLRHGAPGTLTVRSQGQKDLAVIGARAAGLCVFHAFIEHARGSENAHVHSSVR